MSDRFRSSLAFIYEQEGGKLGKVTTEAHDAGGPTGFHGITETTWIRAGDLNLVESKPLAQATDEDNATIYRVLYWDASQAGSFLAPLDLVIFDAWVQHPPRDAARMLQEAASYKGAVGLTHDGVIGGATIAACRFDPRGIAVELIARRFNYYRQCPGVAANFLGWTHRMLALHALVLQEAV